MAQRSVNLGSKTFQLSGDPADGYFQGVQLDDGYRACGEYLRDVIRHDSICFDIGANIGLTTLAFATLAPEGRVYAFEPSPKNFSYLMENIQQNPVRNVQAFQLAVANDNRDLRFCDTDGFRAGSFLCRDESNLAAAHHSSDQIVVKAVRLDDFVARHDPGRVDFIKIDVEGFEHDVLKSGEGVLRRFEPIVALEFNPYCLVSHANFLPTTFFDYVMGLFRFVYVHIEQTDTLKLVSDVHDRHNVLHDAFKYGLVNLIGSPREISFSGHRASSGTDTATNPPPAAPTESRPLEHVISAGPAPGLLARIKRMVIG